MGPHRAIKSNQEMLTFLVIPAIAAVQRECELGDALIHCTLSQTVLQVLDCKELEHVLPTCVNVGRGPAGSKIIRAPHQLCETRVSINSEGYFTYSNTLNVLNGAEGLEFECESRINSKVSVATTSAGCDEEDCEHDELDQPEFFDIKTFGDGEFSEPLDLTKPWNVLYFTMEPIANAVVSKNMEYTMLYCSMTEFDDESKPTDSYPILEDGCPLNDKNGKLRSFGHSGIPFDASQSSKFVYRRKRKFSGSYLIKCNVQLCPIGMDDSPCDIRQAQC